jgi:putative transposase
VNDAFSTLEPLVGTKVACSALGRSRASYYRHRRGPRLGPPAPRPTPANALSPPERDAVLEALHGRFVDAAPAQAWATLLDEGTYLASESTMYRLLRGCGESGERRRQATHPARTIPELVADEPNRVWSYDVTKLKGPRRGVHYDLFVMLDIFSRYSRAGWSSRRRTPRSRRPGSPR